LFIIFKQQQLFLKVMLVDFLKTKQAPTFFNYRTQKEY